MKNHFGTDASSAKCLYPSLERKSFDIESSASVMEFVRSAQLRSERLLLYCFGSISFIKRNTVIWMLIHFIQLAHIYIFVNNVDWHWNWLQCDGTLTRSWMEYTFCSEISFLSGGRNWFRWWIFCTSENQKVFFSSECFQALTKITEFLNHKYNKAEPTDGEHLKLVETPFGTLFTKKRLF